MRDLVGYGATPPDPRWPKGAKVAVNFVMNIEEGSEASFELGDNRTETALTEVQAARIPSGQRDLAAESMYAYGARAGFWRLHRLFTARSLPLTVFACAVALERNPDMAAAIREAGWDICGHGWRWEEHWKLDEATERDHIARAVASLSRSVGRPAGWYCRYAPSVNTRRLLIEHGGFLYDSDAYDDDLPYWIEEIGQRRLVIPYSLATNDAKFAGGGVATGEDFLTLLRDALDFLRDEPGGRMMSVGMHLRILGQPARAAGLARFLDHVRSCPDVWVCRREEIARHWMQHFSPS